MPTTSLRLRLAQSLRRVRPWHVVLAVLAAWLIVHYGVVPQDWRLASGVVLALVSATAIAITLAARRRLRSWDFAFAGGLVLIAIGAAASGPTRTFPSLTDLCYLGSVVSFALGAGGRYIARRAVQPDVLLEAVIVTAAGTLLVWELVVDQILQRLGLEAFSTVVAIAYPAADLLLLAVVARIVIASPRRHVALWLTVAGCAAYLWSDVLASTQLLGSGSVSILADVGWLASYGLVAAGIVHPGAVPGTVEIERGEVGSRPRVVLLLAAAMVAPVFVLYELVVGQVSDAALVAIGGIVLSVLVVTRLAMALRALGRTIDQRERLQVTLEHQANHDSLTGLANRHQFAQTLERELANRTSVAVLFVDLDDLKAVNDSLGHDAGDQLLREVAARIASTLRPIDLGARLGGDEFAVLLHGVATPAVADPIANRLLDALRLPFSIADRPVLVRASIGIALSEGLTADELMRNADIAMYLAKSQGKDRCQRFDVRLHEDVLARLRVRSELEAAIEAHEFVVHYQPIVDVASGRLTALEALVRWRHPERGLLAPGEFIGVAETTGLIVPVGRWVLNTALADTRRWQLELGRPDLGISVNVSPRQFEHAGFHDDVVAALAASGIAASTLTLEITESSLLNTATTTAILRQLKRLGLRISVDDFGTGYSSLSYVGRLPIDAVKIDRTFVAALGSDSKEGALAASVIRLGHTLDLTTIAEGIEDGRQLELLRALGCDLAQGYFLARPMTAEAVEAFIREDVAISTSASAVRPALIPVATRA